MLFVDAPVGTGFSYATDASEYATSDTKTAAQVYQFLRTVMLHTQKDHTSVILRLKKNADNVICHVVSFGCNAVAG